MKKGTQTEVIKVQGNPIIDRLEKLQFALLDLLNGQHAWYEINDKTGIGEQRSREIEKLYHEIYELVGEEWKNTI